MKAFLKLYNWPSLLLFVGIILLINSCKNGDDKASNKQDASNFDYSYFLPQDLAGHVITKGECSCAFAVKDEAQDHFIYADNNKDLAIMKINGVFVEFTSVVDSTSNEAGLLVKKWENTNYNLDLKVKEANESKQMSAKVYSGELTVTSKMGDMILVKFVNGICGC